MKTSLCHKTPRNLWSTLSTIAVLAAVTTAASFAAHYAGKKGADYPKLSPFTAVRWDEEEPEVEINGQWFKLVSINDVSTDEMLAFSKSTFGRKWQKRFEEDLVELLSLMGHTPEKMVTLVVRSLTNEETQTMENILMTEENRWAIWEAAQAREKNTGVDYPKLSPFTAIRWDNEQPEVEVNGKWFSLVSINDIPTDEILAFSKQAFARKWQKRFEEDLVELLTRMGHTPDSTVKLVVLPLTGEETQTLENVLMTEDNRWAIWEAARAREENGER